MLGAMLVTSMVAGRVTTNTGRYKVFPVVGSVLMVVGLYLLSTMDTGTSRFMSGVFMAVVGFGMGCLMQITMLVAQNSVEMKDMGVASSSTTLFRTLGSSFGVAIMGALFNSRVQDVMSEQGGALGARVTEQSAQLDAASLAKLPEAVREAYQHAVSAGTHSAFLLGAVVAVVALVAAVFVKEVPLRGRGRSPTPMGALPPGMARGPRLWWWRPSEQADCVGPSVTFRPGGLRVFVGRARRWPGAVSAGRVTIGPWARCDSCAWRRTPWTGSGPTRGSTWTPLPRTPGTRGITSCGRSRRRTGRRRGST